MIFKLGELLGRGGFATVYRALDPKDATPLPIAIKKARVSQRIQRPHLRHEARLLRALEGHPAIPRLVAYGHLQHFEYLAMELLGKSLEQIAPKNGMDERTVAKIAVHLLSALEFIHSRGVIHRDIKPANILLTLDHPPALRLIDFGIAKPFGIGIPTQRDPIQEKRNVPGTLHWVSLNAQLGYDTSRRDDVESLAYTLLFLLRGSLPWQRYHARSGTLFGCMKQVREKKRQWPGQRLGEGLANEFGDLLDYARALEFDSKPDYKGLSNSFQRLANSQSEEAVDFLISASKVTLHPPAAPPPTPPRPAPVSRGQLIYVKFLQNVTIEGYTAQALDSSHWEDTSLVGPEWETKKRPAVVLDVEQLDGDIYWRVKVLPLRRGVGGTSEGDGSVIRVSPESMESGLGKRWLWEKIVVFAVPNTETFVCLPDQPILTPGPWSLPASMCASLSQRFDRRIHSSSTSPDEQLKIRIQIKTSCNMYAALSPLEDPHLDATVQGNDIAWEGARGWLDEIAKAAQRRVFEEGREWSNAEEMEQQGSRKKNNNETEDAPSDSNSDPYMTDWWPQGGRDVSVTLGKVYDSDVVVQGSGEKELNQSIDQIESVLTDG